MPSSPPAEAPEFRGKTLTPVSPKPLLFPTPSNIPILEQQMDPSFNDKVSSGDYSAEFQTNNSDTTNEEAQSYEEMYAEPTNSAVPTHSAPGQISEAAGDAGYSESFNEAEQHGDNEDTPVIQNIAQPTQATHNASSEPLSTFTQANAAHATPTHEQSSIAPPDVSYQQTNSDTHPTNGSTSTPVANGTVNLQALLDNLSSATPKASAPDGNATLATHPSPSSALPGSLSLPPRPPPQEKPATHPNYAPGDDIRNYHPHSGRAPGAAYRTNTNLPPLMTATAPGSGPVAPNGLPPPPTASFQQFPNSTTQYAQSPSTSYRQRESLDARSARDYDEDDDDRPWPVEIQRMYDEFLEEERKNVADGQWDKFPINSRLFVGIVLKHRKRLTSMLT